MPKKQTNPVAVIFRTFAIILLSFMLLEGIPLNSITCRINVDTEDPRSVADERASISPQLFAESIEKGLEFLKDTQLDNGGWLEGNNGESTHVTGNCIRALLNYEGICEPYNNTIQNGIEFLKDSWHDPFSYPAGQQRDLNGGLIFNDRQFPEENSSNIMRSHGAATGAMLDYYFHTQDDALLPYINESVGMIVRSQNTPRKPATMGGPLSQGGWGSCTNSTHSLTSLSGWNLFPLILADCGIYDVPDDVFEYAEKWLLSCYDGELFGENSSAAVGSDITAIATYCLYAMGKGDHPAAQNGINYINRQILQWNTVPDPIGSNGNCPYLWYYYSTFSMYLAGGEEWIAWKSQISSLLLTNQNENGSWSPLQNETGLGFNYATALALMCLELVYEAVELSLAPKIDQGHTHHLVELVEPGRTVTYDIEVNVYPISIDAQGGQICVNLTISEPLEGWSAELNTPNTPGDGIVLPDGSRMWWVTVRAGASMERPVIYLEVTAPEIGPMSEPCVISIIATIEDDYRFIQANLSTISILDIDLDFDLDLIAGTEDLGNKIEDVEAGSIKTFQLSIRNLGNVNDSYDLSLISDLPYNLLFDNGGPTYIINLSKEGTENDDAMIDIGIETPTEAITNEIINVTVLGTSRMHSSMGLGTLKRSERITLRVIDTPIVLSCHDTSKYIDPGEKEEYEIFFINNFESTLDVFFSFNSNGTIIDSPQILSVNWSATFPENNFPVKSGESITVIFEVSAPEYAVGGDRIYIELIGVGYDNFGMEYESPPLQVLATVNRIVNVTAEIQPKSNNCYPGGTVNYTLIITNGGNGADVVNIEVYEVPDDWELDLSDNPILIGPYQDMYINIMVTVPGNALDGPDINMTEGGKFQFGLLVVREEDALSEGIVLYADVMVIHPPPIRDITPPRIVNVSHEIIPMADGIMVDINAKVIDNAGVDGVWLTIVSPDGETINVSLIRSDTGDIYSYSGIFSLSGDYSYFFWVRDKENNQNISKICTFILEKSEMEETGDNDGDDNSTKDEEGPFFLKSTIRWMIIGLIFLVVLSSIILVMNKKDLIFTSKRKEGDDRKKEGTVADGVEDEFGRVEGEMNASFKK